MQRRSEDEAGGASSPSLQRAKKLALLKLSTANSFVKGALKGGQGDQPSLVPANGGWDVAVQGSSGSLFFPDPELGSDGSELPSPSSPYVTTPPAAQPFAGLYADYEDVMDLLHVGIIADGGARRMLSHVTRDRVAHVAHLGVGACCSVDLVAVHCGDGARVLAAAKSCYLPPSDPRFRGALREAELLRRCEDCPFIMQLLAELQDPPEELGGAAGGGGGGMGNGGGGISSVPGSPRPSMSAYAAAAGAAGAGAGGGLRASGEAYGFGQMLGYGYGGADTQRISVGSSNGSGGGGAAGAGAAHAAAASPGAGGAASFDDSAHRYSGGSAGGGGGAAAPAAAAYATMAASPAYQAWASWRGGGGADDLDRQVRLRLAAASMHQPHSPTLHLQQQQLSAQVRSAQSVSRGSLTAYHGMNGGGGGGDGSPWSSAPPSPGRPSDGAGGDAAAISAASMYGGGWMYGTEGGTMGTTMTTGGLSPASAAAARQQRQRRGSLEVISMYGGCTGMGMGDGTAHHAYGGGGGAAEAPVMYTLLLGWARCGDLRRLVQLLLSRSAAHQPNKHTGEHTPVSALPPLMREDAARFYTGCLVLALEHLHGMHAVHRDLKLANLLLLGNGYAVVGDLGTAVDLTAVAGGRLTSRVGSPGHMAPECRDRCESGYDTSADLWSLGACLFALLTGHLPAGVAGPPNRAWVPPVSRHWSPELASFVTRLLAWDPGQRPRVAQIMRDPWFRGFGWSALRAQKMPAPTCTPWRELLWWPKENRHLL